MPPPLRAAGQTILVVDKYIERLVQLADRHTIIERGRVAWQGVQQSCRATGNSGIGCLGCNSEIRLPRGQRVKREIKPRIREVLGTNRRGRIRMSFRTGESRKPTQSSRSSVD